MTTNIDKDNIKCVVFDLDGTLLNTIETINYYLNLSLSHHGLSCVNRAETMAFVGNGATKLIECAMDRVGADKSLFDAIFQVYNDAYNAGPYYLTEAYEGIGELLTSLKKERFRLAVLSNKPDFAVKAAVNRFFPHTFDIVLGGRDNIPLKPSPDALIDIMSDLGLSASEIVYIGDSEVDVFTAKNAGVDNAIFVSWGFRTVEQLVAVGASTPVDTPSQILEIIKKR